MVLSEAKGLVGQDGLARVTVITQSPVLSGLVFRIAVRCYSALPVAMVIISSSGRCTDPLRIHFQPCRGGATATSDFDSSILGWPLAW